MILRTATLELGSVMKTRHPALRTPSNTPVAGQ